jgi:hypothetical protein
MVNIRLPLRYLLVMSSTIILIVGLSKTIQRSIYATGLVPNQYRYGDLYNTSCLKEFKEVDFKANSELSLADKPQTRFKNVDLYTIGDSFTPMDTSFYAGDKNYHIWLGVNQETAKLDPAKNSILVIEIIERPIQERLRNDFRKLYIDKGFITKQKPDSVLPLPSPKASYMLTRFGDQINERLEFLLFNYDLILELKELKSLLMLYWFNRTHPGAVISKDQQFLFYDIEANPRSPLSSFHSLTPTDIDSVVNNMNIIREHYLRMGFTEVYFCLIPNKTTVCAPSLATYNGQISAIESHPRLQTPILSVIKSITSNPSWFHRGDGHWNAHGKRFWLRTVNGLVEKWSKKR